MKLRNRPRLFGTMLGCIVSLMALAILWLSEPPLQTNFLDRPLYDWRVKNFSAIEPHPDIVHVDIDNGAVYEVGRWPWSRRQIADLLRVITDLDAQYTYVDLLISEPEAPFTRDASLDAQYLIEENFATVGSGAVPIFGDLELLAVLRDAANVLMAVEFEFGRVDQRGNADSDGNESAVGDTALIAKVTARLAHDFAADIESVAAAESLGVAEVQQVWARSKRTVAQQMVAFALIRNPTASLADIRESALGSRISAQTADDQDLKVAYREAVGRRDMLAGAPTTASASLQQYLRNANRLIPVLWPFRPALRSAAVVSFDADDDGVVRRVPPVVVYANRLFPHLGVAAALEILDLDLANATISEGGRQLTLPHKADGAGVTIPLDGRGNMLIPWTRTGEDWRSGKDFTHISAAALMAIADARRAVTENELRIQYLWADAVALVEGTTTRTVGGKTETVAGDAKFRIQLNEVFALERRLHTAEIAVERDAKEIQTLRQTLTEARTVIAQAHEKTEKKARFFHRKIIGQREDGMAIDDQTAKRLNEFELALKIIDEQIPSVQQVNKQQQAHIDEMTARLRPLIEGKYVFVGFAATAQGDIVPTPIDSATNGVMCHANVLNAFLQNSFVTPAPITMELFVCALLIGLVAPITAARSPGFALVSTTLLAVLFVAVNILWLFQRQNYAMAGASIVVVMFLCWSAVTLFRQLTAERDKRLFRGQLSQYTSPAIAARIAESPEAAKAFKVVQTRDMTCYFSDLAGFTTISEQEDAEVIQTVLNVYLERMSDTIWSYRGLINKFMGDGIMAIYNPSVDPLETHPVNACESALASIEALDALKRERAESPEGRVFQDLMVRIGLATGACKNGDMGSELKADYTVIGDVVNLAARLEPANKVFGTQIMIAGPTYQRVRDQFDVRYLAELQVKGKSKTVPVFELCGRKGSMTEEARAYAARFEEGVALYKARRWDECIVHFTRMLARNPSDLGAARYIDACQELKAFPPNDEWAGALELKEK